MLNIIFKLQLYIFKIIFFLFKKGYPFGIMIWGDENKYKEIYFETINYSYEKIDHYEKKFEKKIDKKWMDELALQTQVVIKDSKINYQHGRVLYSELSNYIAKNSPESLTIIETGTARGFSAVCMSKAINDCKYDGSIISVDILPNDKKIYWNSISDIEGKKTRGEILKKWENLTKIIKFIQGDSAKVLSNLNLERVNFAFLDGSHNVKKLKKEFEWVSKRQKKNDIIVFDDYDYKNFKEICNFVDNIETQNNYEVSKIFSDNNRGYAIAFKK